MTNLFVSLLDFLHESFILYRTERLTISFEGKPESIL